MFVRLFASVYVWVSKPVYDVTFANTNFATLKKLGYLSKLPMHRFNEGTPFRFWPRPRIAGFHGFPPVCSAMPVYYTGIVQGWLLPDPYTLSIESIVTFHLGSCDSIMWQYKISHIHFSCRVHRTSCSGGRQSSYSPPSGSSQCSDLCLHVVRRRGLNCVGHFTVYTGRPPPRSGTFLEQLLVD
jgi:hypothetical protein